MEVERKCLADSEDDLCSIIARTSTVILNSVRGPAPPPRHSALPVVRLKFPSSTCPDLTILSRLVKFAFLGRKSSSFEEKVEYFRNVVKTPYCKVKS